MTPITGSTTNSTSMNSGIQGRSNSTPKAGPVSICRKESRSRRAWLRAWGMPRAAPSNRAPKTWAETRWSKRTPKLISTLDR